MATPLWKITGSQRNAGFRLVGKQVDTHEGGKQVTANLALGTITLVTTGVVAIAVGLSGAASTVQTTTGSVPVTVALSGAASTVVTTSGSVPITVGLSGEATLAGTTAGGLPVTVGLSGAASTLATTTGSVPVTVGLSGAARVYRATTGMVPVAIGLSGAASGGDIAAASWSLDASGDALVGFTSEAGIFAVDFAAAAVPAAVTDEPLMRRSHQIPAGLITINADGRPVPVDGADYPIVEEEVGRLHVWAGGQDVTYLDNIPATVTSYSASLPFGDRAAQLDFPQLMLLGAAPAQLGPDKPVDIAVVKADGSRINLWAGRVNSRNGGNSETSVSSNRQCEGPLYAADHSQHQVQYDLASTDIGTVIPNELNGTGSRKFGTIARVVTGIATLDKGASSDKRMDYVQNLLAKAWTSGGDQWTIARTAVPRAYTMALKSAIDTVWTLTYGAPGVQVNLTRDETERVNVVWGHGVGPDGYAYQNMFFPGLLPYDPPNYPYSDPSNVMVLGTTDADTNTGTGITVWQQRMVELGYRIATDGVLNSDDIAAVRSIQSRRGIAVDGQIGPQTWNATFDVGTSGADLARIRLPMAYDTRVWPTLHAANGAVVGANPAYDPSIDVYDIDIDFGTQTTKAAAVVSARQHLARNIDPGWTGRITLTSCPWEGWRGLIREGDTVHLLGYEGGTVVLHVTDLDVSPMDGMSVALTVDSKARDAMTLASIMERDRESRPDPARKPGTLDRISSIDRNNIVPFEGESPAGRLPRIPINGDSHLWSVWPVFVCEQDILVKVDLRTSVPSTEFAVWIFGAPITPNQAAARIGANPFAVTDDSHMFDANGEPLFGYVESWGNSGERAGHSPGPSTGPITGRLIDTGGVNFASTRSGWLWLAIYSATSCYIEGRLYPTPLQ